MKKNILRIFAATFILLLILPMLFACSEKKKEIVIYASSEDFRIANAQKMFDEKFPEYDIVIEYKPTGDLSSKLIAEGKNTDCDIIMELENSYLEKISDNLAEIKGVNLDAFLDELIPSSKKYVPICKTGGAVIVNKKILEEKNLPLPTSYDDLLKPEYKGLIAMPNPETSGTGYIFYLNRVNALGETGALEYFDALKENIYAGGFTTSGSAPVQAIKMGEAAIALSMILQGVNEINKGEDFEILYFEDGSPYTVYSSAVISGRETDEDVMKVFSYLVSDVIPKDKELFAPEKIYKDKDYTIKNYPQNIKYADMTGFDDITRKESLLDKWKY